MADRSAYLVTSSAYRGNNASTLLITWELGEANAFAEKEARQGNHSGDYVGGISIDGFYSASWMCEWSELAINLGVEKVSAGGNDYWTKKASKEVLLSFVGQSHKPKSKSELVLVVAAMLEGLGSEGQERLVEESRAEALRVHDRVAFLGRTERATASCVLAGDKGNKFQKGELRVRFSVVGNYDDGKMVPKWCNLARFFNTAPSTMAALVAAKRIHIKENVRVVLPASVEGLLHPTPWLEGGSGEQAVNLTEAEKVLVTRLYADYMTSHPEAAADETRLAAEAKLQEQKERARFDAMYQRQLEKTEMRKEAVEAARAAIEGGGAPSGFLSNAAATTGAAANDESTAPCKKQRIDVSLFS